MACVFSLQSKVTSFAWKSSFIQSNDQKWFVGWCSYFFMHLQWTPHLLGSWLILILTFFSQTSQVGLWCHNVHSVSMNFDWDLSKCDLQLIWSNNINDILSFSLQTGWLSSFLASQTDGYAEKYHGGKVFVYITWMGRYFW